MRHEKNGYIFDPESPTELVRLIALDRAITASMGGVMAGISSHPEPEHVLDLACGPGGWVLDLAFKYPDVEVIGVDISKPMTLYAHARAHTQQLLNATFSVMDITGPLDFADGTFDLVNARFLVGVLKGTQWPRLLAECFRLLRPGGVVRLVESDGLVVSTSPGLARLQNTLVREMHERGYGFSGDGGSTLGITPVLSHMLTEAGFQPASPVAFAFDISSSSPFWSDGFHLSEITYRLAAQQNVLDRLPLREGERVDEVIEMMLVEMQEQHFGGVTYGAIVSGIKPEV